MRSILRLRSARVGYAFAALLACALATNPLLGVQGPESAFVLGLVLPFPAALVSARWVIDARRKNVLVTAPILVARSIAYGVSLIGISSLLLVLNAWRIASCAGLEGIAYLAMGPGIGVPMAALLGALSSTLSSRSARATALAIFVPVAFAILGIAEVIGTPAVFVYSELVGWFPGALYDENTGISGAYVSYRASSVFLVLAAASCLAAFLAPRDGVLRSRPRSWSAVLAAIASLVLYGSFRVRGADLGHRSDVASIREALGGHARGVRCDVVAPRELDAAQLSLLADDCDFRIRQAEESLGVSHPGRVTAFFFRDRDEKRRWMGAADTYIAKPWRDEVYLQRAPFPHPVLAHEIAHVIAGSTGSGPFRVSGALGGWIPDASIVEGVAVAVAWSGSEGLTPHEWAQAMIARDLAPPLSSILGGGFYGESSSRAYTLAGSFFRFLLDTRGAAVVRQIYRTGDIASATGESIGHLESSWRAYLRERPLPREAEELAAVRFARGSIFSRPCPHRTAALRHLLDEDLAANDDARTVQTCRQILDLDPADTQTRAALAAALTRRGDDRSATVELRTTVDVYDAPASLLSRAREEQADGLWRRGRLRDAARLYAEILRTPLPRDRVRVLEIKRLACEEGGEGEPLLRELLAAHRPPEGAIAVHLIHALSALRSDGLPAYLEARQLQRADDAPRAEALVRHAQIRGLPTDNARIEARRMLGETAYLAHDLDVSRAAFRAIAADPALTEGERIDARDWLDRIARRTRATEAARRPDPTP